MGSSNGHSDNPVSPVVPLVDGWVWKPGGGSRSGKVPTAAAAGVAHLKEGNLPTAHLQARGVRVTSASSLFIRAIPLPALRKPRPRPLGSTVSERFLAQVLGLVFWLGVFCFVFFCF